MARIRTIKPEFPQSESMGRISREARLLFVLLWTICDDKGKARGNSRILASLLFPYDEDAGKLIDGWIAELEHEGCVARYMVDGSTYIECCNWLKHQKIDKPSPSRLPDFPESSRILANPREPSSSDLDLDLVPIPVPRPGSRPSSCTEPQADSLPPVLSIILNCKSLHPITQQDIDDWQALFPAVDVIKELRGMVAWAEANPTRRKTDKGIRRFIVNWLMKEQDRGKVAPLLYSDKTISKVQAREERVMQAAREFASGDMR